ncbi:MAG: chemotaxis protein CheD [Candidatus Odinarchaeota archaeon]
MSETGFYVRSKKSWESPNSGNPHLIKSKPENHGKRTLKDTFQEVAILPDTLSLQPSDTHFVKIGEIVFKDKIALQGIKKVESTLGSCVGLVLLDSETKFSAFAHIMLPERPKSKLDSVKVLKGKYAAEAIPYMLSKFKNRGIPFNSLEAKIAGGASMFEVKKDQYSIFAVGKRNIMKISELLELEGIKITGKDTGKDFGRKMTLFLDDATVLISEPLSGKTHYI